MLILAIDSSATTATVSLLENDKPIASAHIYERLTHSEKLLPMVDSLLNFIQKSINDVDLIAVTSGPGSFTGVRIGVSCVKGLAYSGNIPVAPISTLEAIAYNLRLYEPTITNEVIVCPCMDARRNELYNAVFSYDGISFKRLSEDRAISTQELESQLLGYEKKVFVLGDGGRKFYEYLKEKNSSLDFSSVPESLCMQNSQSVGYLGYQAYFDGKTTDASGLVCTYLRPSQAERNIKEDKK
jgi:tRNA threonylcarbamoyladenosine biosynthesis protein TsaB